MPIYSQPTDMMPCDESVFIPLRSSVGHGEDGMTVYVTSSDILLHKTSDGIESGSHRILFQANDGRRLVPMAVKSIEVPNGMTESHIDSLGSQPGHIDISWNGDASIGNDGSAVLTCDGIDYDLPITVHTISDGETGPVGPIGPQGEQGPIGPAGPSGADGTSPLSIEMPETTLLVPCDADGNLTRDFYKRLKVFVTQGLSEVPCEVTATSVPSPMWCTVSTGGYGVELVYQQIRNTSVNAGFSYVHVRATLSDGSVMEEQFIVNIVPVHDGAKGEDGYSLYIANGSTVALHLDSDGVLKSGQRNLLLRAYRGDTALTITNATFSGSSFIHGTYAAQTGTLVLEWSAGPTGVSDATTAVTVTVDDGGTTRTETLPLWIVALRDGEDGFSPTVDVQPVTGGHSVTITDAAGAHSFDVLDGHDGTGATITGTLTGNPATASDAIAAAPTALAVGGVSTQDGTPTPEAPVAIKSVDALELTFAGANIFDTNFEQTYSRYALTVENDGTGRFTFSTTGTSGGRARVFGKDKAVYGTAAYASNYELEEAHAIRLPAGRWRVVEWSENVNGGIIFGALGTKNHEMIRNGIEFYSDGNIYYLGAIYTNLSSLVASGGSTRIMVVSASLPEIAEYEPYSATTATINLQGHQLRSLPYGTRDELIVDASGNVTLVQRVGSVDMGTLKWSRQYAGQNIEKFWATVSGIDESIDGYVCMSESYAGAISVGPAYDMVDKTIAKRVTKSQLMLKDTDYSDAQALKASLSGVTAYYALAKPVETALGTVTLPAISVPYATIWATGGSATPTLEVTYERNLSITIANIEARLADLATS